jgi:glutamine cyclotransferase
MCRYSSVWANVLERDCIARIDPASGVVVGWVMLQGLKQRQDPVPGRSAAERRDAVLNGIAYDAEKDRVFVTGKLWANLFEIRLQELDQGANLNRARQECWPADSLPAYGYP